MMNHDPELDRRLVTNESKWPMLTVKPFSREGKPGDYEVIHILDCFKRFYEKSNFEFIMQRWDYADDNLDLNLFFDRFRLEKHTSEFIRDAVGIAKRDRSLIDSKGQWHLYRLKQEMFYWADYPRDGFTRYFQFLFRCTQPNVKRSNFFLSTNNLGY